jgi:hypothetical protein
MKNKLSTIARMLKQQFAKDQVSPCHGESAFGRREWKGYDFPIASGGVLRLCQDGDGEIEVMTFNNPGCMVCHTNASFGISNPNAAIVAYCKEMLK